jgi:6-pyruvoyltetrahydropterin/6-carboxytetrahydropterin synthase
MRAMIYEISQSFFFDAAHTLERDIEAEASRRVHGHTYHAEVTLRGERNPATGMVRDLGHLRAEVATLREKLDHRMLNEVDGIGRPTLENIATYIAAQLTHLAPNLYAVRVWREGMGDSCTLLL